MIYSLKYLRGDTDDFEVDKYDMDAMAPYRDQIQGILCKRQTDACADWKAFGEDLSGNVIEKFDINKYQDEYINAPADGKDETFIGKFVKGAMAHKGMVSNEIFGSGNRLVGFVEALMK